MEQYDEKGQVICQECGKSFGLVTRNHLIKTHNMTFEQYKEKWPKYPTASKNFISSHKNNFRNSKDEISLDSIPPIDKNLTSKWETMIDGVKNNDTYTSKILEYPNSDNINKKKLQILNGLISYFPDIENSYFIEKFTLAQFLQYRLITDMAIPSLKIDLEFPNTFWHNKDLPKEARDPILINDGWTIVNIPGDTPTIEKILNILKNYNLISSK